MNYRSALMSTTHATPSVDSAALSKSESEMIHEFESQLQYLSEKENELDTSIEEATHHLDTTLVDLEKRSLVIAKQEAAVYKKERGYEYGISDAKERVDELIKFRQFLTTNRLNIDLMGNTMSVHHWDPW